MFCKPSKINETCVHHSVISRHVQYEKKLQKEIITNTVHTLGVQNSAVVTLILIRRERERERARERERERGRERESHNTSLLLQ